MYADGNVKVESELFLLSDIILLRYSLQISHDHQSNFWLKLSVKMKENMLDLNFKGFSLSFCGELKHILQYLKSNLQILFIHKTFVQVISCMSIIQTKSYIFPFFSPGICNLKNSFGGPLVRVLGI